MPVVCLLNRSCSFVFQVKDVNSHTLENRMESFFLAETIKYLYLLFDPDNFIHNTGDHGTKIQTPNGECIIDTGSYIFNTEGHPFDTDALYCCSAEKKEDDAELQHFHDNIDLLALLDVHDDDDNPMHGTKWNSRKRREKAGSGIMGDFKLGGTKWKSSAKGEHQNILSTEGKVFTVKDLNVPVINLEVQGNKVVFGESKEKQVATQSDTETVLEAVLPDVEGKQTERKTDKVAKESCDVNGNGAGCSENIEDSEKNKYTSTQEAENKIGGMKSSETKSVNDDDNNDNDDGGSAEDRVQVEVEEKYGLKVTADMKKPNSEDGDEDEDEDDDASDDDDTSDNNKYEEGHADSKKTSNKQIPSIQKPVLSLGRHGSIDFKDISFVKTDTQKSGLDKINQVMDILKSMTTDLLSQSGANVKTLHEKLKYYSLFKVSDPELMTCKAQPFHMRFSTMGEMFLEDKLTKL